MSKNGIRGYVILGILFAVFSVFAFAIPVPKRATFWIAYLFGVFSIVFQVYVFRISFSGGEDVKSKIYGFPIAKIGVIYLVIQLLLSCVEVTFGKFLPVWVALILNVLLTAVALVGCIAADVMRDEVVRQEEQRKLDVGTMRDLQSVSATLAGQHSSKVFGKDLQTIADEFKFSDPVSSEQTKVVETELADLMENLKKASADDDVQAVDDLKGKVLATLAERNRLCRLNK